MKRDPSYITFLNMEWVPTAENYNLQEETEGLKRSPEALKDDLLDFLHILCSHLPHGYLTDRIISKSTSLLSAFRIIDESFNLLPNQESFFEFKGLKKMSSETYRQMFDRMVAFSSQHLMPARTPQVDVDGVLVPDGGDALTVSHLNLIALLWLDKLSPDLLNIVRTEYAKELRDNEPLAGLVPRISQNVDHLLLKYEKPPATHGATVNLVHEQVSEQAEPAEVYRLRGGGRGRGQAPRGRGGQRNYSGGGYNGGRGFCPGCFYLSKQLSADISFSHDAAQCPRKAATVMLLEAEDAAFVAMVAADNNAPGESAAHSANARSNDIHQGTMKIESNMQSCSPKNILSEENKTSAMISHIKERIDSVSKASSPSLWLSINDVQTNSVVDEGSELVVMDFEFAKKSQYSN